MDPVYRKVVDDIFMAVLNESNMNLTLDQVSDAIARHLELYFIPRSNELLRKEEKDIENLNRFRDNLNILAKNAD